jgi:hypothetical protein
MLVCELEELPRDGRKLQHAIHEFWSARKKQNLLVFACFNMAFWVGYTWLFWLPGQTPPAPVVADAAPVVVVEGAPAPGAAGAELGALPTAPPAPAPPAPGAELGEQAAAPAYPAPAPAPAQVPPAPGAEGAAPVIAVAGEPPAPAGDQAAAPVVARPHRMYLSLIVKGDRHE